MDKIDSFTGKYFFLSNFYETPIIYQGIQYPSSENAYQAAKVPIHLRTEEWTRHQHIKPNISKRLGRRLPIRPDWNEIRDIVMYDICTIKFENPELSKLLLETAELHLIEGNTWNDTYWGVCKGEGKNQLGKILMQIRFQKKLGNI